MSTTRLGMLAVGLTLALITIVTAWQLAEGFSWPRLVTCIVITSPLWIALHGLHRRHRKTFAWATLGVIPYFVLGLTEAVANPRERLWAALCLAVGLTLFVTLILYLRASNPQRAARTD